MSSSPCRLCEGAHIEDYGAQLGRAWGIGHKGVNDGVILLVAKTEHKVRIEVGYGLEKRLTDPFAGKVHARTSDSAPFAAAASPTASEAGSDADRGAPALQGERCRNRTEDGTVVTPIRALILLFLLVAAPAAAQNFPKLTGRVVDAADLLTDREEAALTQKLQALETATHRQLVVATVPNLQGYPVEDYGYKLGRAWGIGQKGANNGVILLVAPRTSTRSASRSATAWSRSSPTPFRRDHPQPDHRPLQARATMPAASMPASMRSSQQLQAPPEQQEKNVQQAAAAADQPARQPERLVRSRLIFWAIILAFVIVSRASARPALRPALRRGSAWPVHDLGARPRRRLGRRLGGGGWGGGGGGGWRRRRRRRLFGRRRLVRRRRSVGRMVMLPISDEDRARIAAAVAKAEAASDGEIVTIVAPRSDAYHDVGAPLCGAADAVRAGRFWALAPQSLDRLGGRACCSAGAPS